jgi:preprotein translocase subunit Sec63
MANKTNIADIQRINDTAGNISNDIQKRYQKLFIKYAREDIPRMNETEYRLLLHRRVMIKIADDYYPNPLL